MRILTWNIRHGGSAKGYSDIVRSCHAHDPDIIVLTEYRLGKGAELKKSIGDSWPHIITPMAAPSENTILIASRRAIHETKECSYPPVARHRWLEVVDERTGSRLLGVHIPGANDKWDKKDFWAKVVGYAKLMKSTSCMIIGDFNTGLAIDAEGAPFACPEYIEMLCDLGWIDAWRSKNGDKREFSWYSRKRDGSGNGFRLDYVFLSPVLAAALIGAKHSQAEREQGISDHSILIVDLDLSQRVG